MTEDLRTKLDAWRERGVDRADRVRFDRIEALARRALACRGTARSVIEARIAALLEVGTVEPVAQTDGSDPTPVKASRDKRVGPLGVLSQSIAQGHKETDRAFADATAKHRAPGSEAPGHEPSAAALGRDAQILEYFRDIWSRISAENQWREFPTLVPENAGPLNTSKLVYRSMNLMRTLSPEYLKQFLTYVDALSWMEQMTGEEAALRKEGIKKEAIKKDGIRKDAPKKDAQKAPAAKRATRKKT